MPKLKTTTIERLLSKIDRSSGCWNWTAGKDSDGYGQMRVGGRKRLCHRLSYEEHRGVIPAGQCVLHRCDNPACINPEHLFLGTQPQNIADMIAKGRDRKACLKGEAHSQAKLTEADVIEIRAAQGLSQTRLGAIYGVSPSQIGQILRRENWTHV